MNLFIVDLLKKFNEFIYREKSINLFIVNLMKKLWRNKDKFIQEIQ